MTEYTVGVIGTGAGPGGDEETGMAMGYRHGDAYTRLDSCELVACADVVPENASAFADAFGLDAAATYTDHVEMLHETALDIVSVTTPITTHAGIVLDCATAGDLAAVHCEKPMADTWGGARLMAQECARRDVQLTFDHQLRFSGPVQRAAELVETGAVGEVTRVEGSRADLFESGTHQVDLCSHFAGDSPGEWVVGAVDYRDLQRRNGAHIEGQSLALWRYENGVHGLLSTGHGADAVGVLNRVVGTAGVIELDLWGEDPLRVRRDGQGWESVDCEYGEPLAAGVAHVVDCLDSGTEPLLSARRALTPTELMFGVYESVRRRGRVDLPLEITDNPLVSMVESGALDPSAPEQ
jgi:predicted dehydrogenase